jgi:CO dehydrogenase maturation factor
MEAGLEHLSKAGGTLRHVDLLLVVVGAEAKVLMTAERLIALASQLGIPSTALVGNRVSAGDRPTLEAFATDHGCTLLAAVPDDDAIRTADRDGVCPLDRTPQAPAVRAIDDLAAILARRVEAGTTTA